MSNLGRVSTKASTHLLPSNTPPTRSAGKGSQSTSAKSTAGKKYTSRLTDADREYLRNNNGCFWCRKTNTDHMATNCPDRLELADKMKEVKKESVSALEAIGSVGGF